MPSRLDPLRAEGDNEVSVTRSGSNMTLLAYLFVVVAVAMRLLPHPWHFTPIAASLLFFGSRLDRKALWKYLWIPVALVVASDCYLTLGRYQLEFSWLYLAVSVLWYAAMVWVGSLLRDRESAMRILGASLTASVTFFVVSNAIAPWIIPGMYATNVSGVVQALAAGVPFFRPTLFSDLLFTAAAFGTPYMVRATQRWLARDMGTVA